MATKNQTRIIAEPGKQELFIIREFEAPRDIVFKAFSDPKLYARWVGPCDMVLKIDKFEARTGGSWRDIFTDPKGNEYGFHGVIHELRAPERIIRTFEFEGLPEAGHVTLETARLEALPGNRTKLTVQMVFQSVADRDGMIQSGMEHGVNDSHERLDEILEGMLVK